MEKEGRKFLELIKELDKIDGVDRFRISSIEPNLLSEEIIDFVSKSNKFQPHFHIPLQSGSDDALSKCVVDTELNYGERIGYIKNKLPKASIGVDVIVGFLANLMNISANLRLHQIT